jgi:hypothetical protein
MPDGGLLALLALSPSHWLHGTVLLAFAAALVGLVRHALMLEAVLARAAHQAIVALAVLPGVAIGAVLVFAAVRHPERAWPNLGIGAILLGAWYAGGMLGRVVRPDLDTDDARWVALGACIALPVGALAALAFG